MEFQRKFLLENSFILEILTKNNIDYFSQKTSKFFISISKNYEIFIKKTQKDYFFSEQDIENPYFKPQNRLISKEEYKEYKKSRISAILKKDEFRFEIYGNIYILQTYENVDNLVILKIEFLNQDEFERFDLGKIFLNLKYQEITNNQEYFDSNIALYNTKLAIEEIDENNIAQNVLSNMSKNLQEIKENLQDFNNTGENFSDIYNNFLCLKNEFMNFSFLFDDGIYKKFYENFEKIIEKIEQKCFLDRFVDEISDKYILFKTHLLKISSSQNNEILKFLHTQDVDNFILDFEYFLQDNSGFYLKKDQKIKLRRDFARLLRYKILDFKRLFRNFNIDNANEDITLLCEKFYQISDLLDKFCIFDLKSLKNFSKEANLLKSDFENLEFLYAKKEIIGVFENVAKEQINEFRLNELKSEIFKEIFVSRYEIYDKTDELFKDISIILKSLKVYH